MQRILVLLDLSNMYYTLKRHREGRKLGFKPFLEFISDLGTITHKIAYGGRLGPQANTFITYLKDLGFETKYKEVKEFMGADGQNVRKANWDVGIAVDMICLADTYDTLVLGTADGDLVPAIQKVIAMDKRVIVFGCKISRDLQALAHCIEIPDSLLEPARER